MQYTVLDDLAVNQIMAQYGIKEVSSFKILSGGSENTNYLIRSNSEKFVLTICEQKSSESAMELVRLLETLAANKFETSKVIRTNLNEPITYWKEKPVMLKVFLEGEIIEDLPNQTLELIGAEMGKLHQIDAPDYLPKVLGYGQEFFHETSIYAHNSMFDTWLNETHNFIKPFIINDLPKVLIHSDIFYSNIIVSIDREVVNIMDFEEAANYYRIFDVGMTIVGLCSVEDKLSLIKAKHLLKGYQKEIELLEIEKQSLQAFTVYAAAAMTFWRHRNFNQTNPDPDRSDHYLGLKVIADFVKGLPEESFLEILT